MSTNISKLADELKPYFVPWVRKIAQGNGGSAGGGGTPDMVAHTLADTSALGTFHTVSGLTAGQVLVATAATAAHFAQLTHSQLGGVSADQHHAQSHAHDSSDHTGTLAWATVNKTGSSLGHLASRQYTDLQGTGSTYDVVAWTATDTITKRTPSADVSAGGTELLRSNAGALTLATLTATTKVRTPLLDTASGALTITPATYAILSDGKSLRTTTFASGFVGSGFRLDQGVEVAGQTSLTVDNLWVRGTLNVYELLIHQIRATNGSIFVTNTMKIARYNVSTGTEGTIGCEYRLYPDTTLSDNVFAVGDLVRAQRFTGAGAYQSNLEIIYVEPSNTYCIGRAITAMGPGVGYDYVRLGNVSNANRRGGLYMTADDSGAPYLDVFDGVQAWTGSGGWNGSSVIKLRLGKLDGITGGTNEYGLWAGSQTLGNVIVSGGKVALRQGTTEVITLASDGTSYFAAPMTIGTSGEIRQGTGANTFTPGNGNFVGLRMWRDTNVGRIGGYGADATRTGGVLHWYGSTDGKLYAGGGNVTLDSNGVSINPGTTYADYGTYGFRTSGTLWGGVRAFYNPGYSATVGIYATPSSLDAYSDVDAQVSSNTYRSSVTLSASGVSNGTNLFLCGGNLQKATLGVNSVDIFNAVSTGITFGVAATFGAALDTSSGVALDIKQDGTSILYSAKTASDATLQLGNGRTVNGNAFIDLVGDSVTYTDYGLRLIRGSGTNASSQINHRGTGGLYLSTYEAASIYLQTSSTARLTIDSSGLVGIGVTPATQKLKVLGSIAVGADEGGTASYTTLTNATSGKSTGTGTVKLAGTSARDSTGWVKAYVGTTAVWLPYWDNIGT